MDLGLNLNLSLFDIDIVGLESEDGITLSRLNIRLQQDVGSDRKRVKKLIGYIKIDKNLNNDINVTSTIQRDLLSYEELEDYDFIVNRAKKLFEVESVCLNYGCAYLVDGVCASTLYVQSILEGIVELERKFLDDREEINVVSACNIIYCEFNK